MVSSMTGYAAVTRELAAGTLALELKSVNSRFLDVQFRIAEELRTVEPALRELAMAAVGRGKLDCRLAFTPSPLARDESALNGEALARLARMSQVVRDAIPDAQPFRVVEVLHWAGVLGDEPAAAERVRDTAIEAMRTALAELVAARSREGEKLARMIRERLAKMRSRLAEVEPLVPKAIAAYEEKLAAHLDEAERVLASGGAVGKRLDFLMQELNREANTLGAKSVSKELSAAVLEFKVLIEQMREQVQNLE